MEKYVQKQLHKNKKRQTLGAASVQHDLVFAGTSTIFTGEVRIGTAGTIVDVVFDTGSDWLIVQDMNCTSCNGVKVNSNISGTLVTPYLNQHSYNDESLYGYQW